MADMLIRCFYDGMSKKSAIQFLEKVYHKKIKSISVKTATKTIKDATGEDW